MDDVDAEPSSAVSKPKRRPKGTVVKEKLIVKRLPKGGSAYAVLCGSDFVFFVRQLVVSFGKGVKRGVDIHLGDCSSITRKHAAMMFNWSVRRWELVVFGKAGVLINSVPFSMGCNPILLDSRDMVEVPCDSCELTHGFYFLLPKRCPDRGVPAMHHYHVPKKYEKGPREWTNTERERFQRAFLSLGYHRPLEIKRSAGLSKRTIHEVEEYSKAFLLEMRDHASGEDRAYLDALIEMENLETTVDGSARIPEESLASWKKIRRSANSWSRRIRSMHFIQEIARLHESEGRDLLSGVPASVLSTQPPAEWWTSDDDRNLIIGTHRHGYARYEDIRNDSTLVFSRDTDSDDWPTTDQLTRRVKRLAEAGKAAFLSKEKERVQLLRNEAPLSMDEEEEDSDVPFPLSFSDCDTPASAPLLWNKKQTSDFLRSLMIMGIPRAPTGEVVWSRLKNRESLQAMPESALVAMYRKFVHESKRIVAHGEDSLSSSNSLSVSPSNQLPPGAMTLTVAKKFRQRIRLLRMVQKCVSSPSLKANVRAHAPTSLSSTLPPWWKLYDSDCSLLIGIEKHGVGQWSTILQDPELDWPIEARDRSFHPRSEPLFKRARRLVHEICRQIRPPSASVNTGASRRSSTSNSFMKSDGLEVVTLGILDAARSDAGLPVGYLAIVEQAYTCTHDTKSYRFECKVAFGADGVPEFQVNLLGPSKCVEPVPFEGSIRVASRDPDEAWTLLNRAMCERLSCHSARAAPDPPQSGREKFGLTHPTVVRALKQRRGAHGAGPRSAAVDGPSCRPTKRSLELSSQEDADSVSPAVRAKKKARSA